LQAEIDGVFTGGDDLAGAIEEVARLGARLLLKTAIEAEVTALFLGRERYERAASRVRHSNFIERTFGETRRRVKVIGRLPGEHSCLKLVWAVLDRASTGWRGFTMTPAGLRLLAGAAHCTTRRPNSRNGIRKTTPKPAWHQLIPSPSHRIMIVSERNLLQATFTPLLGRRY
jgi:transposase-like protein